MLGENFKKTSTMAAVPQLYLNVRFWPAVVVRNFRPTADLDAFANTPASAPAVATSYDKDALLHLLLRTADDVVSEQEDVR